MGGGVGGFGGGMGHTGGGGLGRLGGGVIGGLGGAHAMAGGHAGIVHPGGIAGRHQQIGRSGHFRFRDGPRFGGLYGAYGYDDCYWRRLTEPWLPYCY
jgi:hypothetical protein